jgi:predicted dehydrogenase
MPTRIALVGVGRWGRRLLPGLAQRFDVRLACTRGNLESADWLRTHAREVEHTASLDRVLDDDSIEAVVVATPIESHAEIASRALGAGKHVFVEKPLATSIDEATALIAAADQSEHVLFVGHTLLYDPAFAQLRSSARDDPVELARMTWRKLGTFDSDLFWNLVSHHVSLALALLGEQPTDVELLAAAGVVTDCDLAIVRLAFPDGRHVITDVDRVAPNVERSVTVASESGALAVWRDGALHELRDGVFVPIATGGRGALDEELDAFAAAVERGAPFPSDGSHAAAVVETVARIRGVAAAAP